MIRSTPIPAITPRRILDVWESPFVSVWLFCCVNYLQLKAELTGKIKNVASLETEWSQLKEENDAYESQVTSETDLNQIKKIAIGRLGMTYPSDTQKRTYSVPSSSYVRQYQDVPESKR